MRRSLSKTAWLFVLVGLSLGACSTSPQPGSTFWSTLNLGGASEVEHFETVSQMIVSADATVVGTFDDFEKSRTIRGDASEDIVVYASVTLSISRVLAGEVPDMSVPVEFLIPATTEQEAEDVIASFEGDLPAGEVIAFLRDKDGTESGLFRVVNSVGLWAATERSALDTPLAEIPPSMSGLYADELDGVDSIGEMAARIETIYLASSSSTNHSHDKYRTHGMIGGVRVPLSDCAATDFSVLLSGEVNTLYDTETRILELSTLGPDGVDVRFWVDVDDPVCRAVPALSKQIRSAVRATGEVSLGASGE
jgi:hypothetical protein